MTNFEVIAGLMKPKTTAPLYSLLCDYWLNQGIGGDCRDCRDCPLRYRCDRQPEMTDAEIEAWLKAEVKA